MRLGKGCMVVVGFAIAPLAGLPVVEKAGCRGGEILGLAIGDVDY